MPPIILAAIYLTAAGIGAALTSSLFGIIPGVVIVAALFEDWPKN